jgi:hypothetical protein
VKTLSPFRCRHAGENRATSRALGAHRVVTARRTHSGRELDGMGRPKAVVLGRLAGLQSSGPLRPWAAMRPRGIVKIFNFLWIYSNLIQIQFGLN